ncbi:eCIS core domain-containing protein [Natronobiforma cellulositropha]|uniref:eCIS core domain-containing protein n=1 Tax=Natronobiforma cellulositropha TaxID=1679076 RepID=UPI003CCD5E48
MIGGQHGTPLEGPVREEMEARMGDSFSDVQLHTGPEAAKAASALEARAFTTGNHVVFNRGEYDPGSAEGKYLLAHELAHVRQQTGGAISMLPQEGSSLVIDPDPELEREADEVARMALEGEDPIVAHRLGLDVSIQRTPEVSRREVLKGNVGLEEVEEATGDLEFGDVDHSKVAAAGFTSLLPVIGPMLDQYVDQKFAPQQLQARLRQIDPPEEWVEQTARRAASMVGNIETGTEPVVGQGGQV